MCVTQRVLSEKYPKVLPVSIGTPKAINFRFVPNEKLMGLDVTIFKHIRVQSSNQPLDLFLKRKGAEYMLTANTLTRQCTFTV